MILGGSEGGSTMARPERDTKCRWYPGQHPVAVRGASSTAHPWNHCRATRLRSMQLTVRSGKLASTRSYYSVGPHAAAVFAQQPRGKGRKIPHRHGVRSSLAGCPGSAMSAHKLRATGHYRRSALSGSLFCVRARRYRAESTKGCGLLLVLSREREFRVQSV